MPEAGILYEMLLLYSTVKFDSVLLLLHLEIYFDFQHVLVKGMYVLQCAAKYYTLAFKKI